MNINDIVINGFNNLVNWDGLKKENILKSTFITTHGLRFNTLGKSLFFKNWNEYKCYVLNNFGVDLFPSDFIIYNHRKMRF